MGAPFSSQYLARRDSGAGWLTTPISPGEEGNKLLPVEGVQLDNLFKAFSPDLSTGWNLTLTEPLLAPAATPKVPNLYRRNNAGDGSYQACSTTAPSFSESNGPQLQGVSADQNHAIWRVQNKLTEDASSADNEESGTPIFQLYECSFGAGEAADVRLISQLPNGKVSTAENTAGTAPLDPAATDLVPSASWLANAISADGSRVFWTASPGFLYAAGAPGPLYVRVNASEGQSPVSGGGKCTKSFKACTYSLSASVGGEAARFWGADPQGERALMTVETGSAKGDLYLFDVDKAIAGEEPKTLIAHKALGVLGASTDLNEVYFLSEEAIGGEGTAGKPNLYVYQAGEAPATSFVATLSALDAVLKTDNLTPINQRPDSHSARVSGDGQTLVFMSNSSALAEATAGYDNTDLESGEPDAEIYRYVVGTGDLACVSCNRSGARPRGRDIGVGLQSENDLWAASRLVPWETSLYAPRDLSEDGSRVYFESFEPLALSDTNGKADVYQWEQAGRGGCEEGDASYVATSGGCVSLISAGKSPADSEFLDAGLEGEDVFIRTASSLVAQDPRGTIDIYDARVGGGFASPLSPPAECEGEACQSPPPGPNNQTPSSASFHGSGNLGGEGRKPRPCAKGKHKVKPNGKARCVKNRKKAKHRKKHRQHRRSTGTSRRAGR